MNTDRSRSVGLLHSKIDTKKRTLSGGVGFETTNHEN